MGNVTAKNMQREPLLKGFGASLGFGAVMSGGFGSLSAIKANKGIKNALKQTHLSNEVVNEFLRKNPNADIFTRNYAAARNYEEYSKLVRAAKKAEKTVEKITARNGKLTFWQKITNFGKKSDDIISNYRLKSTDAAKAMNEAQAALKQGKEIASTKILSNSLKRNAGALFKEELLNPFNLLYAVSSIYTRVKEEALPVFKEQGKIAGIKQVFVSAGKSVADIVSNAGFSAVFRMVGSTVGKVFGPVGSAVGGFVGDLFGTFLSNKIITKIFKEDKKPEKNIQNASNDLPQKQPQYQVEYDPDMQRLEEKLKQLDIAI